MCGIAGYISKQPRPDASLGLRAMADAIVHRGPDDSGFLETITADGSTAIGLAHRRLAIIDLASGHQPLGNEDGSIQIVFNGEIYNFQQLRIELMAAGHRFATQSDTETIVHAYEQWGVDCVHRLRGMFAFAIWDAPRQRLMLARDRFGKKPLFLRIHNGVILFASEIKAILAFRSEQLAIDPNGLWDYFSYRYVPGPATLFNGIRKLAPGTYAVWQEGRLTETSYYMPPDSQPWCAGTAPDEPVHAFSAALDEAVRLRMISDVPFGAFLSGGIDSSTIVGLMCRHARQRVKTFAVGFADAKYSELHYARAVANQFATDHHELTITHRDVMEHLPSLIRYRDAPVAEPSDIPIFLLAREARRTVKMVLTGEGADEILGGYPKHVFERYVAGYQRVPTVIRNGLIEPLVRALPYGFSRASTAVTTMGISPWQARMPRWFGAMSNDAKHALLALGPPAGQRVNQTRLAACPGTSALRSILCFDQRSWLPDNLLERGDRMTMAVSLEARMPFMDHRLAELVSSLPDHWRIRGLTTKRVLRAATQQLLPGLIRNRPKVGFRVPVNDWFRGPMRDFLLDHLSGPACRTRDYYHPQALAGILREHLTGRRNHEKLLWSLLTLELWHREYRLALPG